MLRYKKTIARLKNPSRFHSYKIEDKFQEFIEPRKILEEKGFIFPMHPTGVMNNLHIAVVSRWWVKFFSYPQDQIVPDVKSRLLPATQTTTVSQHRLVLLSTLIKGLTVVVDKIIEKENQAVQQENRNQ